MTIPIGSFVNYTLDNFTGSGVVIGYPHYSPDGRVVVVATEVHHGMPINTKWVAALHKTRETVEQAVSYRKRYQEAHPEFLTSSEHFDGRGA